MSVNQYSTQFDIGTRVRVKVRYFDPDNPKVPANPGSAQLSWRSPDNRYVAAAMTATPNPAEYIGTFLVDYPGVWHYRVETPTPLETAIERDFYVKPSIVEPS